VEEEEAAVEEEGAEGAKHTRLGCRMVVLHLHPHTLTKFDSTGTIYIELHCIH
jgi:hypothetical protein